MRKPTAKQLDKLIAQMYYKRCNGVQINIMDIGKIFAAGQDAYRIGIAAGQSLEAALVTTESAVVAAADRLRQSDVRPSGLEAA